MLLHLISACNQEWLGLKTGWSSRELCHQCRVTHTAYAVAPSLLHELPRRDLDEVKNYCTHAGIPSNPATLLGIVLGGYLLGGPGHVDLCIYQVFFILINSTSYYDRIDYILKG